MRKHKNILILLLLLVCITGGSLFLMLGKKEVVRTEQLPVQDDKETKELLCNDEFWQNHYGVNPKSVTAVISANNTLQVTNVPQTLQVVVTLDDASVDGNSLALTPGSFSSGVLTPDANGAISYAIPSTISAMDVTVNFQAREGYNVNPVDPTKSNSCNAGATLFQITPQVELQTSQVENTLYNTICKTYRDQYGTDAKMKEAVPYCFEPWVEASYDEETVQDWINIAVNMKALRDKIGNLSQELPLDDAETVSVTDPETKRVLMCDAYKPDIINKDGTVKQYANSKKFSHTKTLYKGTYCNTVCKETVTVNYQAPVATQAGLCFSYRVEVKSKVECKTEMTGATPTKKQRCEARSTCYHPYNGKTGIRGGPDEEFDQCVAECDGGKYSQSCINSCYHKVYGNVNQVSNMLTYTNNAKVFQMANGDCNNTFTGIKPTYIKNGKQMSAEEVYNYRQKNPGGEFVKKNGVWTWVPGGSCPSQLGYFYFSTVNQTAKTLQRTRSTDAIWNKTHAFKDRPFQSVDSFLKEVKNGNVCNATCKWTVNSACNGSGALLTKYQIDQDYQKQVVAMQQDLQKCAEKASCNETTTEYTITVDGDDKNSPNYKVYKANQKPGTLPSGTDPSIIEEYGGKCYGETSLSLPIGSDPNKNDGWDYRNVVTFPKTWLSVKTGLTTNKKPANESHYVPLGNTFCTSLKTPSVNVDWYKWKVYDNADSSKLTAEQKKLIEKNRKDNISVHIGSSNNHLWGAMGWNFDVSCFYASTKPNECTEECCGTNCPTTNTTNTTNKGEKGSVAADYTFRSITLEDVFPPSKSNPAGRSPRYNWSCEASNTQNENYPVQPSATIESIEAKGNSIFTNPDELDYEIDLTKSDIKKVQAYNKTRKNYLDYDESAITSKTDGIAVYTSSFLTKTLGNSIKKRGIAGCNNQSGNTCDNAIIQDGCYNALK